MVLYANWAFSWFFLTHNTKITQKQYLESQFCSKIANLNTQSTVLRSKMAVLGLIVVIFCLMYLLSILMVLLDSWCNNYPETIFDSQFYSKIANLNTQSTVLQSKMVVLGPFLVSYANWAFLWFFWPYDTTIIHNQYLEPQFCSKFTILNTQNTVLQS